MGKRAVVTRTTRRSTKPVPDYALPPYADLAPTPAPKPQKNLAPIEPKTPAQSRYIHAIKSSQLTFGVGPAGTGKTWVMTALAAQMLMNDEYDNLILTRPAIEVGAGMGFLPGTIEEKYEPYLMPFRATLNERLGKSFADYMIKTRRIEPLPLAYMRGMSFKRSIILLDEAQNCTQREMKMFLTRIGEDCKVIVDGDSAQSDIDDSGLEDAILRCSHIPAVKTVRFSRDDVVRSGLCSEIVMAYDEPAPLTSYGMA